MAADAIFTFISLYENCDSIFLNKIWLKYVHEDPTDSKPEIMAETPLAYRMMPYFDELMIAFRDDPNNYLWQHYDDVIMGAMVSRITSLTIVYSTVYSDADQSKHQSSASLAFVWEIHRGPVNSPHKWPLTRKMFPFDDVMMERKGNQEIWDPDPNWCERVSRQFTFGVLWSLATCNLITPTWM